MVDMRDENNNKGYASYSILYKSESTINYALHISGYSSDSFAWHNLSTKDNDNDQTTFYCAKSNTGAW